MRPTVVCLVPTKNEAMNLPRFLACASLWADVIVVVDQRSTDETREIAAKFPKVRLFDNDSKEYNELDRQRRLMAGAREAVSGPRLLVAIDADEIIAGNFLGSTELEQMVSAEPGTFFEFRWANLLPGCRKAWVPDDWYNWALMDDGREPVGGPMHCPRLPWPGAGDKVVKIDTVRVLHYQYVDWKRMWAKQMWYQCWESLNSPKMRAVDIYRRYHHMFEPQGDELIDVPGGWFDPYERQGITVRDVTPGPTERWDREIIGWMLEHGPRRFARLDVWGENWEKRHEELFGTPPGKNLKDPRSMMERAVFWWLKKTQRRRKEFGVRAAQKLLKTVGW